MQQADTQKVDSLLTILKKKKIIYPVVCLVFRKRIRLLKAPPPLPSEVISIKEYMNGMSTFIQYLTK